MTPHRRHTPQRGYAVTRNPHLNKVSPPALRGPRLRPAHGQQHPDPPPAAPRTPPRPSARGPRDALRGRPTGGRRGTPGRPPVHPAPRRWPNGGAAGGAGAGTPERGGRPGVGSAPWHLVWGTEEMYSLF